MRPPGRTGWWSWTGGQCGMDGPPKKVFSQVELLRRLGLSAPETVELCWPLRKAGQELPLDALTVEECAAGTAPLGVGHDPTGRDEKLAPILEVRDLCPHTYGVGTPFQRSRRGACELCPWSGESSSASSDTPAPENPP